MKTNVKVVLPRRCKYCRANFVPERPQDAKRAKFCCPNHQKAYWRYGGLPFDKMKNQIMKDVRKFMASEFERLAAGFSPEVAQQNTAAIKKLETMKSVFKQVFTEEPWTEATR